MSNENSFVNDLTENFKLKLNLSIRNQLISNLSNYIEIINGKPLYNEIKLKLLEESDQLLSILIGLATGKKIRATLKEPIFVFDSEKLKNTIEILMRNQGLLNSSFSTSLNGFKKKLIVDNDNLVKCLLELEFDKSELFEIDYELIENENIDLSTADILRNELKQNLNAFKNNTDKIIHDLKMDLDKYCLNVKNELIKQLNTMRIELETKFITMKNEEKPNPSTNPSTVLSATQSMVSNNQNKIDDTIFSFDINREFFDKDGAVTSHRFYSKNNTIFYIDAVSVKACDPNSIDHIKLYLRCEDRKGYQLMVKYSIGCLNKFNKPNKKFNYLAKIYGDVKYCPYICSISTMELLNPENGFIKDDKITVIVSLNIEFN